MHPAIHRHLYFSYSFVPFSPVSLSPSPISHSFLCIFRNIKTQLISLFLSSLSFTFSLHPLIFFVLPAFQSFDNLSFRIIEGACSFNISFLQKLLLYFSCSFEVFFTDLFFISFFFQNTHLLVRFLLFDLPDDFLVRENNSFFRFSFYIVHYQHSTPMF
ncbi:unnamed protein product [Acanthosepion pharaonis]|uniref:Uncharacterized protein n=1 Tax=Acanthosepion pharaonis TaxID=158019 RepID=A0A812BCV9_ACAPH|nr:unnamed protein product [Sepia pharaonis]